jgi:hypothetical protein
MPTAITKTGYKASELKKLLPEAFDYAFEKYVNSIDEVFWTDEIMDSLKAIFKYTGILIDNYSISMDSPSWVKFSMNEETENLTGQKAFYWIKKNVLNDASFKRVNYFIDGKKRFRYDIIKKDGKDWSCEFTGVCYDHDFIDSLLDYIKCGCTLSEAFHNLADKASNLVYQGYKDQSSEDYFVDFADANEFLFDENGKRID